MDFTRGGKELQQIRKKRGLTQEQIAEIIGVSSNTVSRIERGLLVPALPTLIDFCNALGTNADTVLAGYITADAQTRWSPLAEKLGELPLETQGKIETILETLIDTLS